MGRVETGKMATRKWLKERKMRQRQGKKRTWDRDNKKRST